LIWAFLHLFLSFCSHWNSLSGLNLESWIRCSLCVCQKLKCDLIIIFRNTTHTSQRITRSTTKNWSGMKKKRLFFCRFLSERTNFSHFPFWNTEKKNCNNDKPIPDLNWPNILIPGCYVQLTAYDKSVRLEKFCSSGSSLSGRLPSKIMEFPSPMASTILLRSTKSSEKYFIKCVRKKIV